MNLDILTIENGKDLPLAVTDVHRAANVISTQLGSLEYAPDFGSDLKFFLDTEMRFPTDSFKSYLIQRLAEHHINVGEVLHIVDRFSQRFSINVGDSEPIGGLIE